MQINNKMIEKSNDLLKYLKEEISAKLDYKIHLIGKEQSSLDQVMTKPNKQAMQVLKLKILSLVICGLFCKN